MSDGEASPSAQRRRCAPARAFVFSTIFTRTGALFAALSLTLLTGACSRPAAPLPNDAYVWQRKWTPAVNAALHDSRDIVRTWRVLAAERDRGDDWTDVSPDWNALAAAHAPVIAVLRIDGQAGNRPGGLNGMLPPARVVALIERYRQHGIVLTGIEIDHDCPTSQLGDYTRFIAALRTQLDPSIALSITALPTWLDSAALDDLLAHADEAVLQVHAVMNPAQGLFDPVQARAWLRAFARRTQRPWRVALPTYGSRVTWNAQGRVAGIESENPMLLADSGAPGLTHELVVPPQQIDAFVTQIEHDALPRLAGIVWFRLPTGNDDRAWSAGTWRAVLTRAPLNAAIAAQVRSSDTGSDTRSDADSHADSARGGAPRPAGLFDVSLVSSGNADAPLPAIVRTDASCSAADGINGYALDYDAHGMLLRRVQPGLLRAGMRRTIGWLRCGETDPTKVSVHVESPVEP